MKNTSKSLAASAILLSIAGSAARADIAVNLNGQPLATSVLPLQVGGRTLVPMRDIFEALGANLSWNPVAQTITAHKDLTTIQLAINNPNALVNGRNVVLEQPATLVNGRTFVPLRFVAESTGAQVDWNAPLQLISIRALTPAPQNPAIPVNVPTVPAGTLGGTQVADSRIISIPDSAVIPVQIDQTLSSSTARVGQNFTATVISRRLGDSEFPAGTKIEGRVVEARPSANNQPGTLDFEWTGAVLPDGSRVPLRGQLTSLDSSNVQMTGGRIVAAGARKDNKLKVIGVGAGAGFVLGRVLGTNSAVTTILGAAGGYLFGKSRDRKAQEATIAASTTLGVRLDNPVRYADVDGYSGYRAQYLRVSDQGDTTNRYDPNYYGFDESSAVPLDSQGDNQNPDRYAGYDYGDRLPAPAPVAAPPLSVGDIYPENTGNNADPRFPDNRFPTNSNNLPDNRFPDNRFPVSRDNRFPTNTNGRDVAGYQQISIPSGAVVPVTLDQDLSSATARVGQNFSATVISQQLGDSEFPAGSKIEGRVIEARPQQGSEPGTLDLEFRTAILPDGTRIPLSGDLISLDEKAVQTQGGRIVAKAGAGKNDRLKVIGIGAAAGFVVGRVLKKDGILPALLGALGGYAYSAKKGDKPAEARVPQGARLGVRLDNDVRYNDSTQYYAYRSRYLRQS